jgi:hypothetical protein
VTEEYLLSNGGRMVVNEKPKKLGEVPALVPLYLPWITHEIIGN